MRQLKRLIFLLFFFFVAGYYFPSILPKVMEKIEKKTISGEKESSSGFSPAPFPVEDRPFVCLIIGRNNGANIEKTLDSVFSQKYDQFRVIYIDDASNDGSYEMARDLIYETGKTHLVTLVKNEEMLGHVANVYRGAQACQDGEIIVLLNGEDRLAHEWVLSRLNQYYADPDLWLTFGQYMEYPAFKKGICRPILSNEWSEKGIRKSPFVFSHLKTFYASLFKKIEEQDLIYQGKHISLNAEFAYMIPMLEMAKNHYQFIPEVLYLAVQNRKEDREAIGKIEAAIRDHVAYSPLSALLTPNQIEDSE